MDNVPSSDSFTSYKQDTKGKTACMCMQKNLLQRVGKTNTAFSLFVQQKILYIAGIQPGVRLTRE
jgi:hypothetical protein